MEFHTDESSSTSSDSHSFSENVSKSSDNENDANLSRPALLKKSEDLIDDVESFIDEKKGFMMWEEHMILKNSAENLKPCLTDENIPMHELHDRWLTLREEAGIIFHDVIFRQAVNNDNELAFLFAKNVCIKPPGLTQNEKEEWKRKILEKKERMKIGRNEMYVVVDTNIFLSAIGSVFNIQTHVCGGESLEPIVVVPQQVLNELDGIKSLKKRYREERSFNARFAVRLLNKDLNVSGSRIRGQTIYEHLWQKPFVASTPDEFIVKCAAQVQKRRRKTILLSNDNNLRNISSSNRVPAYSASTLWSRLSRLFVQDIQLANTETYLVRVLKIWVDEHQVKLEEATEVDVGAQWPPIRKMDVSLSKLISCKKLSITSNHIIKIDHMSTLVNLKDLYLSNNSIRTFKGLEAVGETLENISISYNLIENMKGIEKLKKLTELHMAHNIVSNWNEFMKLQHLDHLRVLSFSGNPLEKSYDLEIWKIEVIERLPTLRTLDGELITEAES